MAEFLSQDEIDALLGICKGITSEELPFYAQVKRDDKFGILTISAPFLKEKLGLDIDEQDVFQSNIVDALKKKNIEIIRISESKMKLVKSMQDELVDWEAKKREMAFNKKYLNEHPEYTL